jgi:hypothetical protein
MLTLYKHETCNKKQVLKALGLRGVKRLNLKPVGFNTVITQADLAIWHGNVKLHIKIYGDP